MRVILPMPHLWHDTLSIVLVQCDKTHCDRRTPTSLQSIRATTPTITALLLLIPLGNGLHLHILLPGILTQTHRQLVCRRWPPLTFAVSLRLYHPHHGRWIRRSEHQCLDLRATTCRTPAHVSCSHTRSSSSWPLCTVWYPQTQHLTMSSH